MWGWSIQASAFKGFSDFLIFSNVAILDNERNRTRNFPHHSILYTHTFCALGTVLSVPQLAFFSLARTLLLFFFTAGNLSCQVCFSLPSSPPLPLSWPLPALRLLLNLPVTSAVNCRQFCRTLRPHGKWQSKQQGLGAVVWFFLAQPSLAPLKLTGLPWLHGSLTLPHSQSPFQLFTWVTLPPPTGP